MLNYASRKVIKIEKEDIEVRKKLLTIYLIPDKDDMMIDFEFGENVNTFFTIGVLEYVKDVLLSSIEDGENE